MHSTTLTVLAIIIPYVAFFGFRPKHPVCRPLRFLVGFLAVLAFGTIRSLDPEGRSVRLGPIRALVYAWEVSA